jgi:hypothetical protein
MIFISAESKKYLLSFYKIAQQKAIISTAGF